MGRYPEKEGRALKLKVPGYHYDRAAPSIKLVKGKYSLSENPGVQVWAGRCHSYRRRKDKFVGRNRLFRKGVRPILLIRHHSVQGLELWRCSGCDVLIRVQKAS